MPGAVRAIVDTFSSHPEVAAIALGGSHASGCDDGASDYDIYVYVDAEPSHDVRRDLASRFDLAPEIGNTWFGPGDEWEDRRDGTAVDIMYWERATFERDLRAVIEGHRPALGYTTAFWHTVRQSVPLHDRDGWLAGMRDLAATPYPEPLRRAIVAHNWPLLRATRSSYRHQIELAVDRHDPVSVQHRVTALLASAFDILFAVNRTLHPGEKRLLDHVAGLNQGDDLASHILKVVRGSVAAPERDLLPAIDALCDALDGVIRDGGLADVIDGAGFPPVHT
jgi:predicted nucleotidyltransferase